MSLRRTVVISTLLLLGIALRVGASVGPLWLDEITSVRFAQAATSPFQLLFQTYSDNNHWLNSLWLYFLDSMPALNFAWWVYRLPALGGGILTLLVIIFLNDNRKPFEQFSALLIFSSSYLLVLYSSEARGYGVMCGMGALALLAHKYLQEGKSPKLWLIIYWLSCCLGFAAQFTFLHFYAAFLLTDMWHATRPTLKAEKVTEAVYKNLPVLLFISAIYLFYIRYLPPGSGDLRSYLEVLINLVSVGYGGPELSPYNPGLSVVALGITVLAVILIVVEIALLFKEKKATATLFVTGIFIVPALSLAMVAPRVLYERYLLAALFFAYFCFVSFLGRIWERSFTGRLCACSLLGLFIIGNALPLVKLYAVGRGQYPEALEYVRTHAAASDVQVSGDHDFRNRSVIDFYQSAFPPGYAIHYSTDVTPQTEWYFVHSQSSQFVPPGMKLLSGGGHYKLVQQYDSAPISGWRWFLYQQLAENDQKEP